MQTIRNEREALVAALVMLRVIERGGSYNTADWYARMHKLHIFVPEEMQGDLHAHVISDLTACKAKIGK